MLKIFNGNFDEDVLKNEKLILVDFFANWCGPCQMLAPTLEKITRENDEFDVLKVDIDLYGDLAKEYAIMYVPTMILFKDGNIVDKIDGLMDEDNLLSRIKGHL